MSSIPCTQLDSFLLWPGFLRFIWRPFAGGGPKIHSKPLETLIPSNSYRSESCPKIHHKRNRRHGGFSVVSFLCDVLKDVKTYIKTVSTAAYKNSSWTFRPLKTRSLRCLETSGTNYAPRHISEERTHQTVTMTRQNNLDRK
jgi:hypothetical protein